MRRVKLLAIWILIFNFSYAQNREFHVEHIYPFFGLNAGKNVGGEIGGTLLLNSDTWFIHWYELNVSNVVMYDKKFLIGPKIGLWIMHFNFGAGMNFIYYSDFSSEDLVIKPEVGGKFGRFKIALGYNARISGSNPRINTFEGSLYFLFTRPTKSLRLKKYMMITPKKAASQHQF